GADGLHGEPMTEDGVMPHLVQLAVRESQARSAAEMHGLTAAHVHVEALVAALHERAELVDRGDVLDAVAELPGDVSRVLGERGTGLPTDPAPVRVLQRLR